MASAPGTAEAKATRLGRERSLAVVGLLTLAVLKGCWPACRRGWVISCAAFASCQVRVVVLTAKKTAHLLVASC